MFLEIPIAEAQDLYYTNTFIDRIGFLLDLLLPVAISIAVLVFFWGLAKFVYLSGSNESRQKGRSQMIWGVVALFVILSIWGLVGFLGAALGLGQGGDVKPPGIADEGQTPSRPHLILPVTPPSP